MSSVSVLVPMVAVAVVLALAVGSATVPAHEARSILSG
jgi:hypothetical protein